MLCRGVGQHGLEGAGLSGGLEAVLEDALTLVGPEAQEGQGAALPVVVGLGEGEPLFWEGGWWWWWW